MPSRTFPVCSLLALLLGGCSTYQAFDTGARLDEVFSERLPPELLARVAVPFELSAETQAAVQALVSPAGGERDRAEAIEAFIFSNLDLRYALTPTRDADDTFRTREGNCLSFVNLFVGIGRLQRLNPFYVEVEDYQRWNYRDGVVLSRGHIVAGMTIDGLLSTFDFLPYRPKAYRDFRPIDDLTAIAHFYNNLGAEALMDEDVERALPNLEIATALAPDFEKAINNLGVAYLRLGRVDAAIELYERGLALHPASVPLLNNLARGYQGRGDRAHAEELLGRLEAVNETNPYFYLYRGAVALGEGDLERALDYMRQALRIDTEEPEVHVGLAKVFLAMGDLERARHHIDRALKLDATHDEARRYAALIERRSGPEAALEPAGPPGGALHL
ncbi:MAG: tetratricopeptide repeat protein [Thermoanaerobaculia bacterium]